ncbi:CPBP family intramembrane glutamic endopeptidase [Loigolactobacillus rennini]|uniref:CAAX family protease n=2 Tax=Loigolactobacillus rennini TaxID=238013 RepID=A0A0R2CW15_9LACO|nr:type II CAAX endopeptidase family protein [Loigolactobacillus rennini]KRM95744.1 CAAX family protease [Loigolactobacillus rennini DSM 20253]SFZ88396.1 CAAX amino terminal protease family protein [Loigolactobacillus rennini]
MTLKKNVIATLVTYLIIYLFPALLNTVVHLGSKIYWVQTLDYIIGACLLCYFYWRTNQQAPLEKRHLSKTMLFKWGIIGFAAALVAQYLASMLNLLIFHSLPSSANTATILAVIHHYPFYLLATVIAAPIMEELVFRRAIFGTLTPLTGKIGAALIASVMFALAHADGHLLVYTSIGLVFCYLYQKTGRIQTSMISHILMNAVVIGANLLA